MGLTVLLLSAPSVLFPPQCVRSRGKLKIQLGIFVGASVAFHVLIFLMEHKYK
jgi:hypothetical protein